MRKKFLQIQRECADVDHSGLATLDQFFYQLIDKSIKAGLDGNYPVASAILKSSSEKLAHVRANNSFVPYFNSCGHAEMNTLNSIERSHQSIKNSTLLITLEPCLMCISRIALSKLTRVVYLTHDPAGGGLSSVQNYPKDFKTAIRNITFTKHKGNSHLLQIGEEMYKIGEKIWQKQLASK